MVSHLSYDSFEEEFISKARLSGPHFEVDAKQVHQIILTLTIGENVEQWIKENLKKANGRLDMISLRNHFRGAGNKSRRVAEATRLMDSLHYRNEKALAFNIFISRAKKMFNIFDECEESIPELKKLRFLWDGIQDPKLSPTVEAIKAALARDLSSWIFVDAADHMASQIPSVNKHTTIAAVGSGGGGTGVDSAPRSGVMKDGKVYTGSYQKDA